jgi:hypothetical protein
LYDPWPLIFCDTHSTRLLDIIGGTVVGAQRSPLSNQSLSYFSSLYLWISECGLIQTRRHNLTSFEQCPGCREYPQCTMGVRWGSYRGLLLYCPRYIRIVYDNKGGLMHPSVPAVLKQFGNDGVGAFFFKYNPSPTTFLTGTLS